MQVLLIGCDRDEEQWYHGPCRHRLEPATRDTRCKLLATAQRHGVSRLWKRYKVAGPYPGVHAQFTSVGCLFCGSIFSPFHCPYLLHLVVFSASCVAVSLAVIKLPLKREITCLQIGL